MMQKYNRIKNLVKAIKNNKDLFNTLNKFCKKNKECYYEIKDYVSKKEYKYYLEYEKDFKKEGKTLFLYEKMYNDKKNILIELDFIEINNKNKDKYVSGQGGFKQQIGFIWY